MVFKKLLLPSIILALAQCLRGIALANGSLEQSHNSPVEQSEIVGKETPSPLTTAADAREATLHRSPLSRAILPLPPLIVPDLLLPPYSFPSFNSQRLDQELRLYLQYLRTSGVPDVLIVGSSRSLQGIDPIALQEALAARGYPAVKVYNFGINGATAQVINLLLQQILTPEQLPKLIIWGDGSRAFNDGRADLTHNGILASAGYQRLAAGDRPIPSRITQWEIPILRAIANKSSLRPLTNTDTSIAPDLNSNGFQSVSERFNPDTYYQRYPWVPGDYDADYLNFNLAGNQTEATVAAARFAQMQHIPLVFVNLPLTEDYLDSVRRTYERQFRQHMWQLADREHFLFRDLSQNPKLRQHSYFVDPSHINRYGARAIAIELAADSTIPWFTLRAPVQEKPQEPTGQ